MIDQIELEESLDKNLDLISKDIKISNVNFSIDEIKKYIRPLVDRFVIIIDSRYAEKFEAMRIVETSIEDIPIFIPRNSLELIYGEAVRLCQGRNRGELIKPIFLTDAVSKFYDTGFESGYIFREWREFSHLYKPAKRELTIITGVPGHGKSEFLDAILIQLAKDYNLKFALFSPENYPHEIHIEKLLSKYFKMPFHSGINDRMTKVQVVDGMNWINEHFVFISPHEDDLSLDSILSLSKSGIESKTVDGVILDPWNEIEHNRPNGKSETEYVGESLMACRRFARHNNVFFWIVAHPAKMYRDKDGSIPIPKPYDIAGSAHWYNKADNCITVFRNPDNSVKVVTFKIKFKLRGQTGECEFIYDKVTGTYTEKEVDKSELPKESR